MQVQDYNCDQDANNYNKDYNDNNNDGYYDSFTPFGYQHYISPTFTCVNCYKDFTSNNKLYAYLASYPTKILLPTEIHSS